MPEDDLDRFLNELRRQPERHDGGDPRARIIEEHVRSWVGSESQRYQAQYADLVRDLVKDLPADEEFPYAVERAGALVGGLGDSCHVGTYMTEPLRARAEVWRHRDLRRAFRKGYSDPEFSHGNLEELSGVGQTYLGQSCRSAKFEALLVDAIVATETSSFGEEIKKNPSRFSNRFVWDAFVRYENEFAFYKQAKGDSDQLYWLWLKYNLKTGLAKVALLYGAPIAVAWWAAANNYDGVAATAIGWLVLIVAFRVLSSLWKGAKRWSRTPQKDGLVTSGSLLEAMMLAYDELKDGASSSPRRVREQLAKVADEGAVWPAVVYAILDLAIARGRGSWG